MIAGIQCERCHGATEAHLRTKLPCANWALSTTEEMSDFCGQCHRTWSQIAINGPRGIKNVRFQPYRLANSKCYDAADSRIRCTACHDPHGALETYLAGYDAKCAACHSTGAAHENLPRGQGELRHLPHAASSSCPARTSKFTDHQIRIARADDPYPN